MIRRRDDASTWLAVLILTGISLVGGCASTVDPLAAPRRAFVQGDFASARKALAAPARRGSRLAEVAQLDLAMTELAAGNADEAERLLRSVRDALDAQPEVAPVAGAASLITDDTRLPYRAPGYEQVMLRTMLAITSLARDAADAESYAMQAQIRQTELAVDAQQRGVPTPDRYYQPVAFAPYVRGVLREATHHDYDDAARAYQLVSQWQPRFKPVEGDILRAHGGVHSQPGHGVLYVFACVGQGPVKRETVAKTTSDALRIASMVVDAAQGQAALPRIAEVPIAEVFVPRSPAGAVGVRIDGASAGITETVTDVGQLALLQSEAEMPWTIARAVARRVTKEVAVKAAANSLQIDGPLAGVFSFAVGSLWESSEQADLRCWGLLPRDIQAARVELPSGVHELGLEVIGFGPAGSRAHPIGPERRARVTITDGQNRYLIVFAPDRHIVSVLGADP